MKKFSLLLILMMACFTLQAQKSIVEATIRALEQTADKAVPEKDTATLKKIWSPDFTVNSPFNTIEKGGKSTLGSPVITKVNYQNSKGTLNT